MEKNTTKVSFSAKLHRISDGKLKSQIPRNLQMEFPINPG